MKKHDVRKGVRYAKSLDGMRSCILAVTVYERRRGQNLKLRLEAMVAEGEISP